MACIIQTHTYRSMRDMTLNYIHVPHQQIDSYTNNIRLHIVSTELVLLCHNIYIYICTLVMLIMYRCLDPVIDWYIRMFLFV